MAVQGHDRRRIALTQLETALRLYFESQDYYSVVALAGAADEIWGQLLKAKGLDSSVETLKQSVAAIHMHLTGDILAPSAIVDRANLARNALKHRSPGQPLIVSFDGRTLEAAAGLSLYFEGHAAARRRIGYVRPQHNLIRWQRRLSSLWIPKLSLNTRGAS